MRFQIGAGGWCCGSLSIPASTILEAQCNLVTGEIEGEIRWGGSVVRPPLPIDCVALDTDSATQMAEWYPAHSITCSNVRRAFVPT
jgi:hypothetical protein